MKINIVVYICIVILLVGCNDDIFIDNFLPNDQPILVVSDADNNKEISFKSNNWAILGVNDIFSYNSIKAYDLNGNSVYLPFKNSELGVVHWKSEFVDFHIEKRSPDKLKFILNENLHNGYSQVLVRVGNEYDQKYIELHLAPTQKYQIDSVVYDWDNFEEYQGNLLVVDSYVIKNNGDTPVKTFVYPYINSVRTISFYNPNVVWNENTFENYLGTTLPLIPIPDIVDNKPIIANTKVAFGIRDQKLETDLDKNLAVEVTISSGERREVIVYNLVERYTVPYRVYLSNPRTAKKLEFSGTLTSTKPINYYILKRVVPQITENE